MEADKMREFAGDIYKECGQLIALIDDIMKLSRLDEGSEELSAGNGWTCMTCPKRSSRSSPPCGREAGNFPCTWKGGARRSRGVADSP